MVRGCSFCQLMPGCIFSSAYKAKERIFLWIWSMQSSRSLKIESELSLLTLFALLKIIEYQTAEAVKNF